MDDGSTSAMIFIRQAQELPVPGRLAIFLSWFLYRNDNEFVKASEAEKDLPGASTRKSEEERAEVVRQKIVARGHVHR